MIYGDHFPGSDVLGKVTDADAQLARRTPIVMLANFSLPERDCGTIRRLVVIKCHFITALMLVIFLNIKSTVIIS